MRIQLTLMIPHSDMLTEFQNLFFSYIFRKPILLLTNISNVIFPCSTHPYKIKVQKFKLLLLCRPGPHRWSWRHCSECWRLAGSHTSRLLKRFSQLPHKSPNSLYKGDWGVDLQHARVQVVPQTNV